MSYETYFIDIKGDGSPVFVVELAALEACQKRLDEAVGLLKDSRCYVESESKYYTDSKELCEKIDTFLAQVKDEGE